MNYRYPQKKGKQVLITFFKKFFNTKIKDNFVETYNSTIILKFLLLNIF
jgi:hypothetical protein